MVVAKGKTPLGHQIERLRKLIVGKASHNLLKFAVESKKGSGFVSIQFGEVRLHPSYQASKDRCWSRGSGAIIAVNNRFVDFDKRSFLKSTPEEQVACHRDMLDHYTLRQVLPYHVSFHRM